MKIGFLNDATGPIAVYGPGFVAASQIAVGLANTIGYSNGVQFEIVYADSGCDGTMGGTAGQALVDAGVWGVVGAACSGASMGATARRRSVCAGSRAPDRLAWRRRRRSAHADYRALGRLNRRRRRRSAHAGSRALGRLAWRRRRRSAYAGSRALGRLARR